MRAVNDLITRDFAAALVNDRQRTVAIHRDAFALAALDGLQIEVLDRSVRRGFVLRRFFETRRTADVERTHRQLRAGFANRLRGDDADRFADLDRPTSRQIASVALDAAAATRFAGQHRTNANSLHAGTLNLGRQVFVDLLVGFDDHRAFNRIDNIFERRAADDAVAQAIRFLRRLQ